MDNKTQQPKKDVTTLEIKHEISPDTYIVVEYENCAFKNAFIALGYTKIMIEADELINFYALTNWLKTELAERKF